MINEMEEHSNKHNTTNNGNAVLNEGSFSVHSYLMIDMDDADKWVHWSKGLKMIIQKNGVTIQLEEDEVRQLVKCLPRTFGGSY